MASVIINIPDTVRAEVEAALCAAGGYTDVSAANAKAALIAWITRTVQNVQTAQQAPPTPPAPITGLS